ASAASGAASAASSSAEKSGPPGTPLPLSAAEVQILLVPRERTSMLSRYAGPFERSTTNARSPTVPARASLGFDTCLTISAWITGKVKTRRIQFGSSVGRAGVTAQPRLTGHVW